MSASRPVAHLYQRARAILAAQIAAGQLGQGTRLTESAVAAQFGISRAPARRALEELARDGLLVRAQGRGYEIAGRPGEQAPPQADAAAVATTQLLSPPRWEAIYTEVEEEIIGRISFARWRVNEAKLARHYAVSRTVAREVVARLQQRGLVLKDERSRWFAPALTPEHVGELYELRAVLEPVALAKAVPHLPPALLPAMRSALESALAGAEPVEGPVLDRLEEEMHVTLLGHCGNRALMQAITMPQSLLIAHRFLYRWTPRLFETEPFLPEHLAVVDHLQAGKVQEAAAALERHLHDSRERALARVKAIRNEFQPEELSYLERL
ncbi:GntR family transcriptional regulator [Aquibaculum arenosum]|uniref:GntR family transcriptional regulator n=1 Tax=Aquibaculum arenosum TaxID=3032591 RepID=A0ABT5YNM9_9PROT|nr:GntR family transcriptional regulator [Fodinicurvata sp. CAU 1616]MDF2096570.1 GntR family transcriptional regulator [Fodinicurvata sp. CAU 1616]